LNLYLNLEGSGPEWEESEKPALIQLHGMGYEVKSQKEINLKRESYNDPLLLNRLEHTIRRLNPLIEEEGIRDAIRQLQNFQTNIAIDANEIAHAKMVGLSRQSLQPITVTEDRGEGKKPYTVKIFDFKNVENNDFLVTNQFVMWGHKDNIYPDVVIFVNGIPLVVIECKSPYIANPIHEAISDNIARYQEGNSGFEKLFYYTQIVVATCGTQAQYATPYSNENVYREWKDPYPITIDDVKKKFGRARKQEILIAGMFSKENLMHLLRNFTVYETDENKRIKKLARYQQFRAVLKTIKRVLSGKIPSEQGGIIWHTQGSGKSLTMLWLVLMLKRIFGNPTVLIVTDRKQLDRQIHDTFKACGYPNPEKAKDKDDLKSMIENNKGKTIMTTIFKFPFFKDGKPHAVSQERVFVCCDEGHRSQGGVTHADMRAALPNAVFFGYTGTPLLKKSKTRRIFGDYIDTYKISQSEADGATLPIYYEGRMTDLQVEGESVDKAFDRITKDVDKDTKEEAKRKYANKTAIASSPGRIKKIALDIVEHYEKAIRPNGLKAMIVAPSRAAAVLYKEELDKLNAPESRIIMTSMPQDKTLGWDKYELSAADRERYAERFKLALEEEGLSILIVVDMLMTGFDAPILQVMYLDQGIKEHNLLQAIARVNRPYRKAKKHGLIVDYWGISKNLRDAFSMYDNADILDIVKPLDDAKHQLELRHKKVMSHFENVDKNDLDVLISLLEPIDFREEFDHDYKQFTKYMEMVLPDPDAIKYRPDLTFLSKTRAAVRTAYIDENLDLRDLGAKVKKLIEESISASQIYYLIPPSKIDNKNFMKLIDSYKSNKVKASVIETKARKIIDENEETNPSHFHSLRRKLEDLIDELKEKKFDDAKTFNTLRQFMSELFDETADEVIGTEVKILAAIYNILTEHIDAEKAGKMAEEIVNALKEDKEVINWHRKEPIMKEMRKKIKDVLHENDMKDFDTNDAIAVQIIGILKASLKKVKTVEL